MAGKLIRLHFDEVQAKKVLSLTLSDQEFGLLAGAERHYR